MLFFDYEQRRSELRPKSLDGKEIESARHQIEAWLNLDPKRREQSDVPPVWKIAFEPDVISALSELSHGRCAFCEEQRNDLVPYRFRPPGYAEPQLEPERKGSYVWLAFNWNNLYPICPDCRPARPNFFPVTFDRRSPPASPFSDEEPWTHDENEKAILSYPGRSRPPNDPWIAKPDGSLDASQHNWVTTIEVFQLNRSALALQRRDGLDALFAMFERTASSGVPADFAHSLKNEFTTGRYGSFLFLFLVRMMAIVRRLHDQPPLEIETPLELGQAISNLFAGPEGMQIFRAALAEIGVEDGTSGLMAVRSHKATPPPLISNHTTPRIKSVALKNFKSLEDIAFTMPEKLVLAPIDKGPTDLRPPEAPCLMLLGENATGKSSILEAIALACSPQETIDQLHKMGKLKPDRLRLNPKYMGQVGGNAKYVGTSIRVQFHDSDARTCSVTASKLTRDAQTGNAPPLLFAFGAHRLAGSGEHSPLLRVATLFDDHTQLANPEDWLRQLDPPALDEVASALRYIIQIHGEFEYIEFVEGEGGKQVCMMHFWRPDASAPDGRRLLSQPLGMASSGYRAVLALVAEILRGLTDANPALSPHDARMSRAIVLIDEIEAHLHPRWKLHIMSGLRRALPNVTFIVTSHDPLCVRGMFNGEVMALNRYDNVQRDGRKLPERVERVKDFENVEAMTIDQLLTSPMFGLFSAESESLNRRLAAASDILSQRGDGQILSAEDAAILDHLDRSIAAGLPFGHDMINDVVREAVAQYLKAQREVSTVEALEKRKAAVAAVRKFLNEIAP